jgi:hypothetical protein
MTDTFTGTTPAYTELLMKELENARDLARAQYQPYVPQQGLERVAPFSPLQEQSFDLAEQMGREQQPGGYYPNIYGEAQGAIRNALGQNVAPFINRATGPTNIEEFYNPFQEQVIRNLEKEGARNLQENILPNVNARFIGAGQYGSTGHQNLTNRAIRDTVEAASKARAGAQAEGFNTALQGALGKQQTQLQGGQLAGKDIERQMLGGEALQNLAGARQGTAIRNVGVLGQLGGQQQQQQQNQSNIAYQNFQQQANFPYQKQSFLSEQLRGLQPQTQVYPGSPPLTPPMQPQASPYTQAGGLLAGMTGAYNQRPQGYAHGGVIKKLSHHRHYAEGGPLSPIQQGANHAIDTAELQAVREQANKFSRPNVDPFWSSIARAGFDIAANRQPGVLAKLGQAGGAGLSEYHSQLANQDQRDLQSAKIMEMIDNTKRLQAERNREHAMKVEEFGEKKRQFGMEHGIHAGLLGLAKEKFEHEKGLYEKGLKGIKGLKGKDDLYKKSNQAALEESRKSITTLPALKNNLNQLKILAEKLDTGPTKGRIARASSTLGSLAGVGTAEDIDAFDSLTNSLVLDLGNQLKGSQIALGKLKIIEQSKPQLTKVKGGNLEIINHMKDLTTLAEDKARFINKALKSNVNAIDAEDAFNQYADAKLEYEERGEKFPNKPEDFLEGLESGKEVGIAPSSPAPMDLSSMSDEELMKIAGVQ